MPPALRSLLFASSIVAVLGAAGCDSGGEKTVVPVVQEPGTPADPSSLARAKRDGPALWWREHAMRLGIKRGLPRVGATRNKTLLPIADVDAKFHSANVTFYRWPKLDEGKALTGAEAQHWLVIPILLRPDRVLENEQFSDYLEEGSPRAREIDAVVLAGAALLEKHAGGRWHMHPVREGSEKNPSRHIRTRVYAIAIDGSAPDAEVVVEDASRTAPAELSALVEVHDADTWDGERIRMRLNAPTAITVARVLEKQAIATKFEAIGADGSVWSIDAETGAIESKGGGDLDDADADADEDVDADEEPAPTGP